MDSGRELGTIGAGNVAGAGTIGICEARFPGTRCLVVANARCSSAWAFFAFCSLGFAGTFGVLGLRSAVWGKFATGRRLKLGSTGLASTLAIKIAATLVSRIANANHVRRTRRQRRPAGS